MRTKLIYLGLGLLLPLLLAVAYSTSLPSPYFLATPQVRWQEVGTITTALPYPSVGQRGFSTVDANDNILVWEVPNGATGFMFAFQTTADADAQEVSFLAFADRVKNTSSGTTLTDNGVFGGSLVLTGGTQTGSHSNVFVDTIVATNGVFRFTVDDSAANRVCIVTGDTKGFKQIACLATTVAAKTEIYWQVRWW